MDDRPPVYVTRGLLEALLELASDAEPQSVSVALATSPAANLVADETAGSEGTTDVSPGGRQRGPDAALPDPETPVFTDFYLPDAGGPVNRVFGVDLGTPVGQTRGRFLSHPDGNPEVTLTDDLHARLLVAIPPWEVGDVTAFDRRSRKLGLVVLDAAPPEGTLE